MPDSQILINIYNGSREPLGADVKWLARLSDGRSLSERHTSVFAGLTGPSRLFAVPFFDNFFDDYTVFVSPDGCDDSGWVPVRLHTSAPAVVDLLALPSGGAPHFANARWSDLVANRPGIAAIVQRGCENSGAAADKYGAVLEQRPKSLACFLNIVTALAEVQLPSGQRPLDYYWNIAWPLGDFAAADWLPRLDQIFLQDRFFCYVEESILPDIRDAARLGSFAREPNPGLLHPDATESYKQTQLDVSNVQLTFHANDTCLLPGPDGSPIKCVKVEPDIDYYRDLLTHGLLEVIPNALSHGRTDPTIAYALRWIAGRRVGLSPFNPLYTVE